MNEKLTLLSTPALHLPAASCIYNSCNHLQNTHTHTETMTQTESILLHRGRIIGPLSQSRPVKYALLWIMDTQQNG